MGTRSTKHISKTPRGEFRILIDKLVYGGEGLGRRDGRVTFVPFSAPGDMLSVQTVESRKGYTRAEIRKIIQPGSSRRAPACRYFGVCGGCHWQHVQYSAQIEAKRNILEEIFRHRFPEVRNLEVGMKPCPAEYGYRSRARIQVRQSATGLRLGFYRMRSHAVEQIEACPLLRPSLNDALASLRVQLEKSPPSVQVCEIEIAGSEDSQRWTWSSPGHEVRLRTDTSIQASEENCLLTRKVQEFTYSVSPSAFFQANDFMVSDLVSFVMSLVTEAGPGSALDLYSGVGLFSLPLAQRVHDVIAVESSPIASSLCQANAAAAGLSNLRVVEAEASDWLTSVSSTPGSDVDLVLLNPPRAGTGKAVMELLAGLGVVTVIYVSCDPQTLSRDLAVLRERGYRIDFVEGLDLFPQTYHFETVVRLRRG